MNLKINQPLVSLFLCVCVSFLLFAYTNSSEAVTLKDRLLTSYSTQSTRTAQVNAFCSGLTRSSLVDLTQASASQFYQQSINSLIGIDGLKLTQDIALGNYSTAISTVQSSLFGLSIFIGVFALGFVVMVLLWPFLLCCCCCPAQCPLKCCRKSIEQQYTKCELYWPAITLMIALLLGIGGCVAGFSQSKMMGSGVNVSACSAAIVFDDLLNGNVTDDGSQFFTGFNSMSTELANLVANITTINNTIQTIQSTNSNMLNAVNALIQAQDDVQKIPANALSGTPLTLAYSTPLNSNTPSSTIPSLFPSVLGSSSNGGLVGVLYTALGSTLSNLNSIGSSASNFVSSSSSMASNVNSFQSSISTLSDYISSMNSYIFQYLRLTSSIQDKVAFSLQLVYGVTIGLCSMMLVGALLVAFCEKYRCRYLIYFSSLFLFVIGLAGFIVALVASVASPAIYYGCQFLQNSLASPSNFDSNLQNIITNSTLRMSLYSCLPTSSGNISAQFGTSISSSLYSLSNALVGANNFDASVLANNFSIQISTISNTLTNYKQAKIYDISDAPSLALIKQIANASAYPSCTATGFSSDSWIPSVSQNPIYQSCLIANGNNATATQCNSSNLASRANSCSGCLDTASIFSAYTSSANVQTALNNRYSSCTTFTSDLANVWQNFYYAKITSLTPLESRAATALSSINSANNQLTSGIGPALKSAITTLDNVADSVTNPQYGLVAGLNCKVFGEDLVRVSNTFCLSLFNVISFTRLAVGIASFGILLALCCGVCTGVRHYKYEVRKLNSVNNEGISETDGHQFTNTNFVLPKLLE